MPAALRPALLLVLLAMGCLSSDAPAGAGDAGQTPVDASACANPCGASCCAADQICNQVAKTCEQPCVPSCSGRTCGSDSCSGTCGSCLAGTRCSGGLCVACTPSCAGKACGDDGCGGQCGVCGSGACVANACVGGVDGGTDSDASTTGTDASTTGGDGGVTAPVNTTIPELNDTGSANHAALLNRKVHVRGVATSKLWRVATSKTGSTTTSCLRGIFLADPGATSADHNGVLVVSKTTVTGNVCNEDSQIPAGTDIGDELDVTGLYEEYCANYDGVNKICRDVDVTGKDIGMPEITANLAGQIFPGTVARGLPSSLPVSVTVSQVNSSVGCGPFTMGSDWFRYRAVYVKLAGVHPSSFNPDAIKECQTDFSSPGDFCNWRIARQGTTSPSMRVHHDVFFGGIAPLCSHRPTTDVAFNSLAGIVYWSFGNSKLEPTRNSDGDPALP